MKFKIKKKDEFDEFDLPYIPDEWKLESCNPLLGNSILHCQFICEDGEYYYADFINNVGIDVTLAAFITVDLWYYEGLAQKIESEKITQIKGIFRVNNYASVLLLTVELVYRNRNKVCFNIRNVQRISLGDEDVSEGGKPYEIDYESDENIEIKTNSIYNDMEGMIAWLVLAAISIIILLITTIIVM